MADAREATSGLTTQAQMEDNETNGTFTSVKAALAAVEQGEPCLHLDLTKPSHEDEEGGLVSSQPMTWHEMAELVDALPRLTQLRTLTLACTAA